MPKRLDEESTIEGDGMESCVCHVKGGTSFNEHARANCEEPLYAARLWIFNACVLLLTRQELTMTIVAVRVYVSHRRLWSFAQLRTSENPRRQSDFAKAFSPPQICSSNMTCQPYEQRMGDRGLVGEI